MNDVNYIVTPVVEHLENVKAEIALLSPEELEQALNTITGCFSSTTRALDNSPAKTLKSLDIANSLILSHELINFAKDWCNENGLRISRHPFEIAACATITYDNADLLLTEAFDRELYR